TPPAGSRASPTSRACSAATCSFAASFARTATSAASPSPPSDPSARARRRRAACSRPSSTTFSTWRPASRSTTRFSPRRPGATRDRDRARMTYRALALLSLVPAAALAAPLDRPLDFHPSSPVRANRVGGAGRVYPKSAPVGGVEQAGEIVIIEGDSDLVSDDGMGNFAIDSSTGQQTLITDRFFSAYPDQFDEIIVFTTFDDTGTPGAAAYEISVRQDVMGIGRAILDDSPAWSANNHFLAAFVDMMRWDSWESFGVPISDPASPLYSTLGQEFAHRWLSTMHYVD